MDARTDKIEVVDSRLDVAGNGPPAQAESREIANPALSRRVVFLFAVACGLAVANVYYAQPLLDTVADEFALSHATVGAVISVTQIGYGLGLLLIVPLGDLLDRRRLIIGQSLLSVLALLGVASARTGTELFVAIAAVGGLAVVTQVLVAFAATLAHPGERGGVVGSVTSGIVTGILLARTVAGVLADVAGWRAVYVVSAAATLVVVGFLYKVLPHRPPAMADMSFRKLIGSVFTLFINVPVLRVRALLASLTFAAITTLLTPLVLPLAAPPRSLTHTEIGLFGLAGAAGALGASRAGHLADRGLAERTTAIGLTLMLVAWLPIAMLQYSLVSLAVGVVVIDFGLQSVHVTNQSLIYRVHPEAQSRLTAGYMIFYSIGCAVGSIGSTIVYAHAGWSGVCILGAAINAVALWFWATFRKIYAPAGQHSAGR